MKKTCKTCGFANYGNFCPILQINIDPEQDTCPNHQEQLQGCPICGQVILKNTGTYSKELDILVCDKCFSHLYTCATCKHHKKAPDCVIEQYHGFDKPVFIQVQQQQGPFRLSAKHINPEVLDIVCPTCTCGNPWNCQRNHKCNNWESCL